MTAIINMKERGTNNFLSTIRVFNENDNNDELYDFYDRNKILLYRTTTHNQSNRKQIDMQSIIKKLYKRKENRNIINETFTIENKSMNDNTELNSNVLFDKKSANKVEKDKGYVWYCSFLIQKDEKFVNSFLSEVPYKSPPFFKEDSKWIKNYRHTKPIWLFLGQNNPLNNKNTNLQGRVEHTDSTHHAGTWHYQVHGKKVWLIRPLQDEDQWLNTSIPVLQEDNNNNSNDDNNEKRKRKKHFEIGGKVERCKDDDILRLKIECNEGDILLINTRLWWHQTEIPSTESQQQKLSCSYARDFMISSNNNNDNINNNEDNYTNVEGIYASRKLKKGDIVLTEDEMPDCELHRCDSPNCEVTEINGIGVLRAIKIINAGDFLTVANSDDDDDENNDDDYDY